MRITWIGHSCFLLDPSTGSGPRVLTDPYQHGAYDGGVRYLPVAESAEIVTVSHSHPDHDHAAGVPGTPTVISTPGNRWERGVDILGVPAFHDAAGGRQRGAVVVFRIVLGGVAVVHLGDLGHLPDAGMISALSPVDVLLLPVGGRPFTVSVEEAGRVMELFSPRLAIPMHYKTAGVDFPVAPVDDFLRGRAGVTRSASSSVEVDADGGPSGILVLAARNLP
jgi:L-ascorbate metabolism protein UlaG (beta-lactamase superfamily)